MSKYGSQAWSSIAVVLALTSIFLGSPSAVAAEPALSGSSARDAEALSAKIDEWIAARWKERGVQPAARTDDAEFSRRVYLDLAGRIPSILEVDDFLDDDRPDKRRLWVDKLLADPTYVAHFANVWRVWLLEQASSEQTQFFAPSLVVWLQDRLKKNAGYDQLVREILTAPINQAGQTASVFLQANEFKAESLAANVSRLFLGVKLECAQCHNHPFGRWTRNQFWELAAFFSGLNPQGGNEVADRREITIPGTDKVVAARYLDGTEPQWNSGTATRATLAEWVTRADNPYFGRAVVNRLWSYFFGTGIIDPLDEPGDQNPPSHPELLDELAKAFAAQRYDLKFLIRAIVGSQAYQLTSASRDRGHDDPRLFARMAVRGLSPEQLFDSIAEAIEYKDLAPWNPVFVGDGQPTTPRGEFLSKFAHHDRRTEAQTTILQALTMMNGKFMADATSLERSPTLRSIADSQGNRKGKPIDTAGRIETLYHVTLSRPPRPEESARLVKYVDSGGPTGDAKKALADVFWALLNSGEFMLNH